MHLKERPEAVPFPALCYCWGDFRLQGGAFKTEGPVQQKLLPLGSCDVWGHVKSHFHSKRCQRDVSYSWIFMLVSQPNEMSSGESIWCAATQRYVMSTNTRVLNKETSPNSLLMCHAVCVVSFLNPEPQICLANYLLLCCCCDTYKLKIALLSSVLLNIQPEIRKC